MSSDSTSCLDRAIIFKVWAKDFTVLTVSVRSLRAVFIVKWPRLTS